MISPERIREKAERLWLSQRPLRAECAAWAAMNDGAGDAGYAESVENTESAESAKSRMCFPIEISLARPGSKDLLARFAEFRSAVGRLRDGSREVLGYGYDLEYRLWPHRQLGEQRIPVRAVIPTIEDLCQLIGRNRDLARWRRLAKSIAEAEPLLRLWIGRSPLAILEHSAEDWERLLAVVHFFRMNPRPNLYPRQLEIAGVDTKFIEGHKRILRELLDVVLPEDAIKPSEERLDGGGFERRFGLRHEGPAVRFRVLTPVTSFPYSDLTVPVPEFAAHAWPCRRVYVVENKINALAFPAMAASASAIVIFGSGYGVRALREVHWLREREVFYWGDIDTHGFAILSALRSFLPRARSLLMDRETLLACRHLWVSEPEDRRFNGELSGLEPDEAALFADLKNNTLGERVRLEQERIPFERVRSLLS